MAKQYRLITHLDTAQWEAAGNRAIKKLEQIESQAKKTAAAAKFEPGGGSAGAGPLKGVARPDIGAALVTQRQTLANQLAAIDTQSLNAEYGRRVAAQANLLRAGEAAANATIAQVERVAQAKAKMEEAAATRIKPGTLPGSPAGNGLAQDAGGMAVVTQKAATAEQLAAIEDKYLKDEYNRRVAYQTKQEREAEAAAAKTIAQAERTAASKVKLEETAAAKTIAQAEKNSAASQKIQEKDAAKAAAQAEKAAAAKLKLEETAASKATAHAERVGLEKTKLEDKWQMREYRSRGEYHRKISAQAAAASSKQAQAFEQIGSAVSGLPVAIGGVGAALLGLEVGSKIVGALVTSFYDAKKAAMEMAQKTLETLGSLKEIVAVSGGNAPTGKDLEQHLKVRLAGGLQANVATEMTQELRGVLGTITEEKIGVPERANLEVETAKLVGRVVKPGDAGTAKAIAQGTALMADYLPGKNVKATDVADMGSRLYDIGAATGGHQAVMVPQMTKTLTALTTSTDMKGMFTNPLEAAALTAISGKFGEENASESSLQAVRELQGLHKTRKMAGAQSSQAKTLAAMKITEFDNPVQAMTKMFDYASTDPSFKGKSFTAEMHRQGFRGDVGVQRLSQLFEQYQKGNFQKIMGMAQAPIVAGENQKKWDAAKGEAGLRWEAAKTRLDVNEIREGNKTKELAIATEMARGDLVAGGVRTSAGGMIATKLASATTLGQMPGEDVLAENLALKQAKAMAGIKPPAQITGGSGNAFNRSFGWLIQQAIGGIESLGSDKAPEEVNHLKRIADSNEAMAAAAAAEAAAARRKRAAVPAPLPGAPAPANLR